MREYTDELSLPPRSLIGSLRPSVPRELASGLVPELKQAIFPPIALLDKVHLTTPPVNITPIHTDLALSLTSTNVDFTPHHVLYTEQEHSCGHLRWIASSWCQNYSTTHQRCAPNITHFQDRRKLCAMLQYCLQLAHSRMTQLISVSRRMQAQGAHVLGGHDQAS